LQRIAAGGGAVKRKLPRAGSRHEMKQDRVHHLFFRQQHGHAANGNEFRFAALVLAMPVFVVTETAESRTGFRRRIRRLARAGVIIGAD
jgi:hypothetical protein